MHGLFYTLYGSASHSVFLLSSNLYMALCVLMCTKYAIFSLVCCVSVWHFCVSHFNHVRLFAGWFVCSCTLCLMFWGSDMKVNVFNHISRCSKCFHEQCLYACNKFTCTAYADTHMNRIRNIVMCGALHLLATEFFSLTA